MELGVDIPALERIKKDNIGSCLTCQRQMIHQWLDSGEASWRDLVKALTSPLLKQYHIVATLIAEEHPAAL